MSGQIIKIIQNGRVLQVSTLDRNVDLTVHWAVSLQRTGSVKPQFVLTVNFIDGFIVEPFPITGVDRSAFKVQGTELFEHFSSGIVVPDEGLVVAHIATNDLLDVHELDMVKVS